MNDHSDGLGSKKLSASSVPQGKQMGRRQQKTITDLKLGLKYDRKGFLGYARHVYRNELAETQ